MRFVQRHLGCIRAADRGDGRPTTMEGLRAKVKPPDFMDNPALFMDISRTQVLGNWATNSSSRAPGAKP